MLEKGQKAPSFSLPDQNGDVHSLADYKGKKVVLYFYPKDDTPGCVKEACTIAEVYDDFKSKGVTVLGVSGDDQASHQAFALKYHLPFTLLSDLDWSVTKDYGAYKEEDTTGLNIHSHRVTYIIDEEGNISKVYPDVDPATHAAAILADLG
jgi:peroxiredoxin Q/BCP